MGRLEANFGASRIGPGEFEVYERRSDVRFDFQELRSWMPFDAELPGLAETNLQDVEAVFFVVSATTPSKLSDGDITITDVVSVTFDWEYGSYRLDQPGSRGPVRIHRRVDPVKRQRVLWRWPHQGRGALTRFAQP